MFITRQIALGGLLFAFASGNLWATNPSLPTVAVATWSRLPQDERVDRFPAEPTDLAASDHAEVIKPEATGQIGLADLESIATANSPVLKEAEEQIEAARGRFIQVGLAPNPQVGYLANEIGNEGSPGQHGAYVGQRFVRGGKLQLNREVARREIGRLQEQYEVVKQRLLTDVRVEFYSAVWLQRRIDLLQRFYQTNLQAVSIAQRLFQAGENTRSDVSLLELEADQTSIDLISLQANYTAKMRSLARLVGDARLESVVLASADQSIPHLTWEDALLRVSASPSLTERRRRVDRSRAELKRATVECIPDLSAQISLQYDFATDNTFTGVQVGMPLPIRNWNQGGIREASASVRANLQQVERVRLAIERDLAQKYGNYENARNQLDQIAQRIVPKAEEVVKIALRAYGAGDASMVDVLNAQRSLLRALLRQQDAQMQLRMSYTAIQGYLLSNSLTAN